MQREIILKGAYILKRELSLMSVWFMITVTFTLYSYLSHLGISQTNNLNP